MKREKKPWWKKLGTFKRSVLQCYSVTVLPCYSVTLLQCYDLKSKGSATSKEANDT